jgi:membrane-bound lytic murein transglycosylase B
MLVATPVFAATATSYTIKSGDTLWGIGQRNHISAEALMTFNHIHTTTIHIGQHLRLPPQAHVNHVESHKATSLHSIHSSMPVNVHLSSALKHLPKNLIPVYQAAGKKYDVSWTVLAAIHRTETSFGMSGAYKSSAGAEGPMQFLPATFGEYGVTAEGQHGKPNIDNVYDAIFSAANMLSKHGYAAHPRQAIMAYNPSAQYVNHVMKISEV